MTWCDSYGNRSGPNYEWPGRRCFFALCLVAVYCLELLVAGSLADGAAYGMIQAYIRPHSGLLFVVSPLLHSSHSHIVGNLTLLVLSGYLTEREFGPAYLVLLYVFGALANFIPVFWAGPAVGISAGYYALLAFVGIVYAAKTLAMFSTESLLWVFPLLGTLFGLFYSGVELTTGIGIIGVSGSAAVHLLGIVFGLVWGVVWLLSCRDS